MNVSREEVVREYYGDEKLYELTWWDGDVEHVVAHYVVFPSPEVSLGAFDQLRNKDNLPGHIVFKRFVDGRDTMILSISAGWARSVRLIPGESETDEPDGQDE